MINQSVSEELKESLDAVFFTNIELRPKEQRKEFRSPWHYRRPWSPETLETLVCFIKSKEPSLENEKEEDLLEFLHSQINANLAKRNRKRGTGIRTVLIQIGVFIIMGLGLGSRYATPGMFLVTGALLAADISAYILGAVRFPDVKQHLADDRLTTEDCDLVYKELPKKKMIKKICTIVGGCLIVAAILAPLVITLIIVGRR